MTYIWSLLLDGSELVGKWCLCIHVPQTLLLYTQSYSSDTVYSCYYILTVISLSNVSICQCHFPNSQFGLPHCEFPQWSSSTSPCPVVNRPFPLTSKYVRNPWRHVWGASAGLLGRIFYCYIREHSLRSYGGCLDVQENCKLPRHPHRVPSSAFSTMVVWTMCNFFRHCRGAARWMCLVCTQRFVVACKCLLTS